MTETERQAIMAVMQAATSAERLTQGDEWDMQARRAYGDIMNRESVNAPEFNE